MTSHFRPLRDRVLLGRVDVEEETPAGIIIPDTAKEKPVEGEVLAVGPGSPDDSGALRPLDVNVGDRVLSGKRCGTEVIIDGEDRLILEESDILGVIEGQVRVSAKVEEELRWDPDINSDDIAVSVKDGVVTLTGFVRSYSQRFQAEVDAKRVSGVLAVANDIEVRLPVIHQRPDPEIARDAVAALKAQLPLSWENVKVLVKSGWITLEGQAEWNYQRERAKEAVRRIKGMKGLTNSITIKPSVAPSEVKRKIEEALKRSAEIDAEHVTVEAHGGEVVLRGRVRSWAERQEAERAAWAAPGVAKVDNQIIVSL